MALFKKKSSVKIFLASAPYLIFPEGLYFFCPMRRWAVFSNSMQTCTLIFVAQIQCGFVLQIYTNFFYLKNPWRFFVFFFLKLLCFLNHSTKILLFYDMSGFLALLIKNSTGMAFFRFYFQDEVLYLFLPKTL